ncbi:MAG: hypothetical protein IPH31_24625 [Lewinellaceae bacterium]|nr:hypothetical protein [Lewinellaceae bacterium]
MTMLLFNPDTQEFEFSHVGDLNVPSNFLQFPNIEGGNFKKTEAGF